MKKLLKSEVESGFELFLSKITKKINTFIHKNVVKDTGSFSPKTFEIVSLSVGGGGKRVRAILSYIISKILKIPDSISLKIAYSIELSHAFTLVHDDVIDKPELRRGEKPIFAQFGQDLAILGGDLLLLLSLVPISSSSEVVKFFVRNMSEVVEGQILDILWSKNLLDYQDKERMIIEIQTKKTSHLFRIAFVLPLLVYESIKKTNDLSRIKRFRRALNSLGFHFGLAFQIKDDIMDIEEDRKSHSPNILDALGKERTLELLRAHKSKVEHYIHLLSRFISTEDKSANFSIELLKYFTDKVLSYEENIQDISQDKGT